MAFLNIENKEDSPEKLAAIVGKPHNQFLFAGELNETVEKINELAAMVPSAIITTGTVTFDEIERKATVSGFGYRLAGIVYTPVDLVSGYIPEEDEGFIKVYHVLGNSLGFLIIAGDSSETQIDPPPVPGTIYLTRFVVTGSVIGEPEAPITGGEFVKKVYSNKQLLFTPASEGIFPLPSDGRTSFEFKVGNQEFYGFSLPEGHEHLHEGKLFYFKNTSGEPILIKHNFAADIKTNLPNGDDLVFESAVDKVLMFKFSFDEGLTLLNVVTAQAFDPADYSLDQFVNPVTNPFLRTEDINIHYRGKFTSLANLETAIPVGNDGDYAIVDAGAGTDAIQYIWDAEEGWLAGGTAGPADTDALPEGVSNLYFTVARALASIPDASETVKGLVSIGTQTIHGIKTIKYPAIGGSGDVAFEIVNASGSFVFRVLQNGSIRTNNVSISTNTISTVSGGSVLSLFGNTGTKILPGNANGGQITIGEGINNVLTYINIVRNFVIYAQSWQGGTGSNQEINITLFSSTINFTGTTGNLVARGFYLNPTLINVPIFYAIHAVKGSAHFNVTTPENKAIIQVESTDKVGLAIPRMTETQRLAISSPPVGGHVYQTDATEGVYVYKSGGWVFAY